jgi:hypothetical protein
MAKDSPKSPARITTQFRKGQAMVYDLSCEDVRLTIEVTLRDAQDGLGEWSVGAHARQSPEKPSIDERGTTRREALSAVASSWLAKRGAYGFPSLDWEAVTQALLAVRAIETP